MPRFTKITRSLQGDDTPHITVDLSSELTTPPGLSVGSTMATMMSTQVWHDATMGTTYVDMVTASMSLVSLSPTSMMVNYPTATLEDVTE